MGPDLQPTLTGKTIRIRPLFASDWLELSAAAADPKIWEGHPQPTRYQEKVFRAFFDSGIASGGALAFMDRARNALIGSSRYLDYQPERGEIDIGSTFLTRAYWGTGANREIKRLMLAHAFTFADTVLFRIGEKNARSRRAMEKIGGVARPEPQHYPHYGPHLVYEITKANFTGNAYWRD